MTLQQLEQMRASVQEQYNRHRNSPIAPGQDAEWFKNGLELNAAIRTFDQIIAIERIELAKPPGALGPTLVGV